MKGMEDMMPPPEYMLAILQCQRSGPTNLHFDITLGRGGFNHTETDLDTSNFSQNPVA